MVSEVIPELRDLLYRHAQVEYHQERSEITGLGGQRTFVPTLNTIDVVVRVPYNSIDEANGGILHTMRNWCEIRTKVNAGRFKGIMPVKYEMSYSPDNFDMMLNIRFSCDSIDSPSSPDDLMGWELTQMKHFGKTKPENKNHFEDELFET